jgi:hypothetical protein
MNKFKKFTLWALAFIYISLYIHLLIFFRMDPLMPTIIIILKIIFVAITCNLGLILISMPIAKKYKRISSFIYIPSVTITPLVAGIYFIPAFLIVIIINAYFFIKFNPWKKNEMESI